MPPRRPRRRRSSANCRSRPVPAEEAARDTADQHKAAAQNRQDRCGNRAHGSETAQGLSEAARAGSEAARDVSVAAKDTADAAKDTAVAAKDTATTKAGRRLRALRMPCIRRTKRLPGQAAPTPISSIRRSGPLRPMRGAPGEGYGAKKYAQNAAASAVAADGSADAAAASAQDVAGCSQRLSDPAAGLETARAGSEAARDVAGGHSTDAQAARDLAWRFRQRRRDAIVEGSAYSAYHWAMKAMSYTNGQASNLSVDPAENLDSTRRPVCARGARFEKAPWCMATRPRRSPASTRR